MRIWELSNGLLTPLNEEEDELMDKMIKDEGIKLTEREELVAQDLVRKDILVREDIDNENCVFRVNYVIDVWRD